MIEAAATSTLVPCESSVIVFKAMLPATYVFQDGLRLFWILMSLFSRVEETHVPVHIKPLEFDPGAYSTLIHCEN
jgi:hypothetical protein